MKSRLVFKKAWAEGARCQTCSINKCFPLTEGCNVSCETNYNYQLVNEGPEEIQSEYEWKKERADLLADIGKPSDQHEYTELKTWLDNNQPERWVTCTKDNTKVGDEVRVITNKDSRTVSFLYNGQGYSMSKIDCVINNKEGDYSDILSKYEINIYGKDKE